MMLFKHKKLSFVILMSFILVLAGCGTKANENIDPNKVNVVTSFYPIYFFANEIGGEDAHVMNLLPTGVEPHDWTPRSQDILNTSKAQLFLYNGAGLESWVPNFLKGIDSKSTVKTIELSKGISLIYTNEDDGHNHGGNNSHQDSHDANHDHEKEHSENHAEQGHEHAEEHGAENDHGHGDEHSDPHTWISPKSAITIAENIKNAYIEVDAKHQANYEKRFEQVKEKLTQLDQKYREALSKTSKKEIVVSHQAFGYLARDYGFTQHAIMGLSPESEPKAQDIVALSKLVKEKQIKYIFFEELVSDKLAKMLAAESGVQTLVLNPVEGLTTEQEKAGENYYTLMEKNLENLLLALN
ncbi:zinc ABC transporter substrate-binding protein [Paenibacillus turicensis]